MNAGDLKFTLPLCGFVGGDFFDIVCPSFNKRDHFIENLSKKNEYPNLYQEGPYEFDGAILNEGDVVFDVGGNIGLFSIIAGKKIGNDGQVFAFEPVLEIATILRKNIMNNGCKNVFLQEIALGEACKYFDFFINLLGHFEESSRTFRPNFKKITVPQATLDAFVEKNEVKKVSLIKAYIKGAERYILAGVEKTIKQRKPKLAIRTYHPPDDKQVLEGMIRQMVPKYTIVNEGKTLYAWVA